MAPVQSRQAPPCGKTHLKGIMRKIARERVRSLVDRPRGRVLLSAVSLMLAAACWLPHVVHAAEATYDLLRFCEFALHGRGCRGYPVRPYQGGRAILSLFPRPLFIVLNIYAPPPHLVVALR